MTATGTPLSRRVGEVVGANSSSFLGQCYRLYDAPPLGCLVRTSSPEIYGVVCRVSTEPLDPGRPILARGEDAESEDEVFRENPQLERLLTSRFETLIVGHQDTPGPSNRCRRCRRECIRSSTGAAPMRLPGSLPTWRCSAFW